MPELILKDAVASIEPGDDDTDSPNGTFEVILSAPTEDRDGDTLKPEDWKMPLPDHITFDMDHAMTVAGTVGSGVPSLNAEGQLVVSGTYSSLPRAQEVRTLVNEGHIKTTSVAFMSVPAETKDGSKRSMRELLNGAFVAIPSNREALVLASKSVAKAGARNSKSDAELIQQIHDHALALGATPMKSFRKDGLTDTGDDPGQLAQAADAAIDEAQQLIATVDPTSLPEPIQQALGLITAAEQALDGLLASLNVPDPDDQKAASRTAEHAPAASAPGASEAATLAAQDAENRMRQVARARALSTLSI
jgi:hypothetical protein